MAQLRYDSYLDSRQRLFILRIIYLVRRSISTRKLLI